MSGGFPLGNGSWQRAVAVATLGFVAHLAFARLATLWEFDFTPIIALWPAVGVVIGIAMVVRDQWWFVLLGAALGKVADLVVFESDTPLRIAIAVIAAQVVEQVLATRLALVVIDPPEILRRASRTIPFVVAGTILAAGLGASTLIAIGDFDDGFESFRTWFIGDGVGMLIGAPTAYGLGLRPRLPDRWLLNFELFVTILIVLAVTVWAFATVTPIAFLVLPAIGWLAVRFGIAASAPTGLVVAVWATWRTSEGSGPFANLDDAVLTVQLFTGAVALTSVVVGAQATEADRQRRRLGGLLASVPDVVLVVDDAGLIHEDYTRRSRGNGPLVGSMDIDTTVADGMVDVESARLEWITNGKSTLTNEHLSETRGRTITYETRFRRIAPNRAVAVARDITFRQEAQDEVRRQARRWRELMSASFEGLGEVDADGLIVEANERLSAIVGRPATSLLGVQVRDLISVEHWPTWLEDAERIKRGERVSASIDIEGRTAAMVVLPRLDADRTFAGALVIALDTTR